MTASASAPMRWWTATPSRDVQIASAVVVVHGVTVWRGWLDNPVVRLEPDDRFALYLTLGATAGVILGFTAVALTIYLAVSSGERLRFLRTIVGDQLDRTWVAVLREPLLAVIVFIAASLAAATDWVAWLVEFAAVILALRLARLAWLLTRIVRLGLDDKAAEKAPTTRR